MPASCYVAPQRNSDTTTRADSYLPLAAAECPWYVDGSFALRLRAGAATITANSVAFAA
jgi:hypothetical protein